MYILSAGIASSAITIAYRMKKNYRLPYLSYYFYYTLIYQVANFLARPLPKFFLGVLGLDSWQSQKFSAFRMVFLLLPLLFLCLYLFICFAVGLVERKLSRAFKISFFVSWGMHFSLMLLFFLQFLAVRRATAGSIMYYFTDLGVVIFNFLLYLYIITRVRHITDPDKRKAVRIFGILYFVGLAFFNLASALFLGGLAQMLLSFAYPLVPLVYWSRFLRRYYREHSAALDNNAVLTDICEKHNISAREQEIIRLVCKGKSNREIADKLFISLPTVKLHVSNIYRKVKVKNRVQLTNYFGNLQKNR